MNGKNGPTISPPPLNRRKLPDTGDVLPDLPRGIANCILGVAISELNVSSEFTTIKGISNGTVAPVLIPCVPPNDITP